MAVWKSTRPILLGRRLYSMLCAAGKKWERRAQTTKHSAQRDEVLADSPYEWNAPDRPEQPDCQPRSGARLFAQPGRPGGASVHGSPLAVLCGGSSAGTPGELQGATAPNDRATVRVDAPDGISEIILGGEAAADNVVLHKAHERDGAHFTLSRNDTQVLRVDPAGNGTVLTNPLQVSGTLKVGGSLDVGGELLLGGVRLSAAMLRGMILNADAERDDSKRQTLWNCKRD
eukprot:scaffold124158_cov70-Phaeocystis_antarctica.AAC.1